MSIKFSLDPVFDMCIPGYILVDPSNTEEEDDNESAEEDDEGGS